MDAPIASCPGCGAQPTQSAKFCTWCGSALQAPPLTAGGSLLREMAGEGRRIVTVLFADVSGFTAMSERLDPEQVSGIMNDFFGVLVDPIYRYGGVVDKFIGDTVMAVFGAPVAHEDDAQRALHAAWEMQQNAAQAARSLEERAGVAVRIRVGLNTGLAVYSTVGGEHKTERTVMGDTVNLAQRMEASARPGQILVTAHTRQAAGAAFRYRELPPVTVKGKQAPVQVYEVARPAGGAGTGSGAGGAGGAVRAPGEIPDVFVAREPELAALERAFRVALGGRPHLVLLSGDPGSGKSALAARFLASASARGAVVLRAKARAYDHGAGSDLARSLVTDLVDPQPAETPESLRHRLAQALSGPFPDESRRVDLAGYLLGLAPRDARLAALEPRALRQAAWDALADWIMAPAHGHAVVVSISDLHWADAASLDWLESLAWTLSQAPDPNPVMILAQHRTGAPERLPGLAAPIAATDIALKPLSESQAWQLATATLVAAEPDAPGAGLAPAAPAAALSPALTPAAKALIGRAVDRSEGNPYYLGQILRSLIESGRLVCRGSGAAGEAGEGEARGRNDARRWEAPAGQGESPLPESVRGAVAARLDALEPPLRELLQVAAVAGRRFDPALIAEVVEQEVEAGLAALIRLRHLRPLPDRRVEFSQSVVHEAALESLLIAHRRELHRRMGLAIEAREGTRAAATLAHHFGRAEDGPRAARYHFMAGKKARAACSNAEAREHLKFALAWLETAELEPALDLPSKAEILLDLAVLERVLGDYSSALARLDRRSQLEPEYPASLRARAETLYRRGDLAGALTCFAQARDQAGSDAVEAALARAGAANILRLRGDYQAALVEAEAARETLEGAGRLADAAVALGVAGICHHRTGDDGEAAQAHARALKLREEAGDMEGVARSLGNLAIIEAAHSRWQAALGLFARSLAILRKVGDRRAIAGTLNNLGDLHLRRGDLDLAERHFIEALKVSRDLGDADSAIAQLGSLAEIWLRRDDAPRALEHVDECLALMQRSGHAEHAAAIHGIRGCALRLAGDEAAALESITYARGLAEAAGNAVLAAELGQLLEPTARVSG